MKCLVITLALIFMLVPTISSGSSGEEFDDLVNETIDDILKDEVTLEEIIELNNLYIGSVTGPTYFSKKRETQKLGIYLNLFGYNPRINISGTHYVPKKTDYETDLIFKYGAYPKASGVIIDSCQVINKKVIVDDDKVSLVMTLKVLGHKWILITYTIDTPLGPVEVSRWKKIKYQFTGTLKDSIEKPARFSKTVNVTMAEHQNAMEISVNGTDIGSIEIQSFGPSDIFNMTNISGNVIVTLNSDTFLAKKDQRGIVYGDDFDVPPIARYENTLITYLDGVFYVPKEVSVEKVIVRSPDGTQKEMNIEKTQVSSNNPENGWKIVLLVLIVMGILAICILKLGGG